MSTSASASAAANSLTAAGGRPPYVPIASRSDSPGRYSVTSHGTAASASAASSGAVNAPVTVRAAATSLRKRARYRASRANPARTTLTATARPPGERPRYTTPIPPAPSRASSR